MYKIPINTNGKSDHFKDYASKVQSAISVYLSKNPGISGSFTGRFLKELETSNTTTLGTGSSLETVLIGDFSQQKALINRIDAELKSEDTTSPGAQATFKSIMKNLFVDTFYEDRSFFDKNQHIARIGLDVCPYCGRISIIAVPHPTPTNPDTQVKPDIDHFLPKSEYPYLALNYFNLVPSCKTCNESPSKSTKDPIGPNRKHEYLMQPYEFRDEDIVFSYVPTTLSYKEDSVKTTMTCKNSELDEGYKNWLTLEKFYEKHSDIVTDMYRQLVAVTSDKYKDYLIDGLRIPRPFFQRVPEMLLGFNLDESLAPKKLFFKFKKDIFREMEKDYAELE